MCKVSTSLFTTSGNRKHFTPLQMYFQNEMTMQLSYPHRCAMFRNKLFCPASFWPIYKLTTAVSISPGEGLISSGEVTEERVVRGVRGEGSVSHALYPLGGGVGIWTPERWQQFSGLDIHASSNFSLSQSSINIQIQEILQLTIFKICFVTAHSKEYINTKLKNLEINQNDKVWMEL